MANVARRKLAMSWMEINEVLALIRSVCPTVPLTIETHDRGMLVAERYGMSVYDAMIVAAALLGGCETLYSEDMQDGLLIDDQLRIRNPFTIQASSGS
jgi:predicted nucleic acid-binding protein